MAFFANTANGACLSQNLASTACLSHRFAGMAFLSQKIWIMRSTLRGISAVAAARQVLPQFQVKIALPPSVFDICVLIDIPVCWSLTLSGGVRQESPRTIKRHIVGWGMTITLPTYIFLHILVNLVSNYNAHSVVQKWYFSWCPAEKCNNKQNSSVLNLLAFTKKFQKCPTCLLQYLQ